jgi:hypothetical protein
VLLHSCVSKKDSQTPLSTEPSFYHWKTTYNPTQYETNILHKNNVQNIYLRFFDVSWDNTYNKPLPVAQLRVADRSVFLNGKIEVIPTVFITNECIKNIQPEQCMLLAENIYKLVIKIAEINGIDPVDEIQIDCDWTAGTKEKYFSILSELQKTDTQHLYSATIRLFQVKYKKEAGVPPVKKGLLMCYNMGNLKSPVTKNSILDPAEVKKYTSNLDEYPLPLDVALPLFSWYVLFRQGGYAGLVQHLGKEELKSISRPVDKNHFEIIKDTSIRQMNFKKTDLLRYEDCSYEDLLQTASILKEKITNKEPRLSLYHLDSLILSKYSTHEIENIFDSFR